MHAPAIVHLDTTLVKPRLRRHADLLPASPLFTCFFPYFSLLLTSHVEYLSLRIRTPSPDLITGRQ